ncbi:MAG: hypothetical protein H0V70_00915 [Ktedonobacteraceae bacterium]|nr:hypothetical protein [Ktedonobacteraceae bacterium]
MADFSSSETISAQTPLPDKSFAHLPIAFLLKPLLITGKAMEYDGLRPDHESTFLVPKPAFERLWEAIPEGHLTTGQNEKGVRLGATVFYVKLFGFSYDDLEIEAMEERDYFVLHIEFLLFLNTVTLIHHPENQQARQDVLLLLERLGVGIPVHHMMPQRESALKDAVFLDVRVEAVTHITVTRLSPDVLILLRQHRCVVDEMGHATILVTFPEQMQWQQLLPPTEIERHRIVLMDGLELRHEIDRAREISLLLMVL